MFDRIIRKLSTPVITEAHLLGFQRPASEADGKVTCCLCVGVWVILRRKNDFLRLDGSECEFWYILKQVRPSW